MHKIRQIIAIWWNKLKYVLAGLLLVLIIFVINNYVNYLLIIDTTNWVYDEMSHVQNEMDYSQYFQSKYLASDYGALFLAHDNNLVFWWETIVSFKNSVEEEQEVQELSMSHIPDRRDTKEQEKIQLTPREAWKLFIEEKIKI